MQNISLKKGLAFTISILFVINAFSFTVSALPVIVDNSDGFAGTGDSFIVNVTVTDDDGGVGSDVLTVVVLSVPEVMVEILIDDVVARDLPQSRENSLIPSLDTASKVLQDSNPKNDVAAINNLQAFINKVEAQRGKKIPVEVADELIAKDQEIIAVLSGGT